MRPFLTVQALRAVLDSMAEPAAIFDSTYKLVYQNAAAAPLTRLSIGATREDIEKTIEWRLPNGELLPLGKVPVMRALQGETVSNEELHVRHRLSDDRFIWIYSAVPIRDEDGTVEQVVVNVRDITEQRHSEIQLERTAQALKQSNADLERFAAAISHDLREPLRVIGSFSQLLARQSDPQLNNESRKFLQYILNSVDWMQELIHDLIEFSRVEAQSARVLTQIDSAMALGTALQHLQLQIEETSAIIHFGELPVVLGNEALLAQLFQNLIGNALKYCEINPHIHIGAELQYNEWVISVADNGIGIDAMHHERIFDVFQRSTEGVSTPGAASGWLFASASLSSTGAVSGSNPNREKDQHSALHYQ